MLQEKKKFVSYIESRIEQNNQLYGRFHLGSFFAGQALTVANALRRTLLAEIPAFIITRVQIQGVNHEFATLPGLQEPILNVLLNIKKLVLTVKNSDFNLFSLPSREFQASLNVRGPAVVTASDIKFPPTLAPILPSHYIATLNSTGELKINFTIQCIDPLYLIPRSKSIFPQLSNELSLDTIPKPIKKVNYGIHQLLTDAGKEFISIEIWTDGSITPNQSLDYALQNLTKIFYHFTRLNKNLI
jgi:DNA-directed RNA polymerase subunit alpha